MHLFVLGLSHKTAPVEVREQLAISNAQLPRALEALRGAEGVREAAILSTCNRSEVYVAGAPEAASAVESFLGEWAGRPGPSSLAGHLYRQFDNDSARHLFQVASGIDSMVLGESEILGQVKQAFQLATSHGMVKNVLDELFRRAISCGKRARSETAIGRGAQSVGSASVELAQQIFGPLQGRTVLILGAGKMSARTAANLVASGAKTVLVANRTLERACELAQQFSGPTTEAAAVAWDEFPERLVQADIVIASTRAPHYVLTPAQVAAAMKARRHRPLFLVDIAVPRDIDPAVRRLDDVFLYDVDDLQTVMDGNRAQRSLELSRVEAIVEAEVEGWDRWHQTLETQPVMAALAQRAAQIRDEEVAATLTAMPHLSAMEQEAIRARGRSVTQKLMHGPLRLLREQGRQAPTDVELLCREFDGQIRAALSLEAARLGHGAKGGAA